MKRTTIFSATFLVLSALFIPQQAQAQWSQNSSTKTITTNADFNNAASPKVGIGTTTPTEAKLVVKGDVGNTVAMFGQGKAGISLVRDWATVGFNAYYSGSAWKSMSTGYGALLGCDPSTGRIEFIQNGYANGNQNVSQTHPLVIEPNGNVGIGSASPLSKLDIAGQDAIRAFGYEPFITLLDNNAYKSARIQAAHGDLAFLKGEADWVGGYNFTTQMVIKDNGNVGIGFATPESKLDIAGQDGLRILGYQPFMTLLDNNSYNSARIQAADGDIHFWKGVANWSTGGYDFTQQMIVKSNGNVLIGTVNDHGFKLAVSGSIRAKEIRVNTNWADYVFADNYQLRPLAEVEAFIKANKHLPDMQPAAEIQENGLDVAATATKMMEKIEELTLYLIDLKKENDALQQRVEQLEKSKN